MASIGTVKEFKNGNINVRFDLQDVYTNESDIINLLWLLDGSDVYLIGEGFCLSNYDMGCMLYNVRTDKKFIVSFMELSDAFQTGKTLKLYASNPDKWDREAIQEELYND